MGFPHLPRPSAPSLELWVQTFSCRKRPCGLHFSSFVTRRRDRRFHKIPKNRGNVVRRPFSQGSWTNQPSKRKKIFRLPGSYRLGRFFVARMRNVASRRAGRDLEVSRNSTEEAK